MVKIEILSFVLLLISIAVIACPKKLACRLGFHGKDLERVHGNRFHTDYHCSACKRDVLRWNP